MKPRIKFDKILKSWACGGLFVEPWYIDWYVGQTPEEAYQFWKRANHG